MFETGRLESEVALRVLVLERARLEACCESENMKLAGVHVVLPSLQQSHPPLVASWSSN